MAFDNLTAKLQNVFKGLRSKGRLTEADVKAALREVKMALLEADVSFKLVKQFINSVTERAIGQEVMTSLTPGQMVIKICVFCERYSRLSIFFCFINIVFI